MTVWLGKLAKLSGALVAVLFVVAQFVPVSRTNPPVQSDVSAPPEVKAILVAACYGCHSFETRWPWYSRVAPISWWVSSHVEKGRKDLNFSRWPAFDFRGQELILHEISNQVATGRMPLRSYTVGHPEARLNEEQRQILLNWSRQDAAPAEDFGN